MPAAGDIWMANLDPVVGHEQGGRRPVLVVSHDVFNSGNRELIIVVSMTTKLYESPSRVRLEPPQGGIRTTSDVLCDQVRTISHRRLGRRMGNVGNLTLTEVRRRTSYFLDLR